MSNQYREANPVNSNGTINVWIHAHTHDDPGWLVTTDQYYVKVCGGVQSVMSSKSATFWIL